MSVYQYDYIRCERNLAKEILSSVKHEPECTVIYDDESIGISWETWHGSPFSEFEDLLELKNGPWIYAGEGEDNNWLEHSLNCPEKWIKEIEVGDEGVKFKEYGLTIMKEDI